MKRFLAFALVASFGSASVAFADESLLTSGTRHTQQIARDDSAGLASTAAAAPTTIPAGLAVSVGKDAAPALQQTGPGTLARSGMRKRTKWMIALGLGVGFAASAWTIDHKVLDVTPSSLGTRED
jgi:hypothetical protein